jgi:hypothetical protein
LHPDLPPVRFSAISPSGLFLPIACLGASWQGVVGADMAGWVAMPHHLLTLWNPSYAADAMDEHLSVLLDWAGRGGAVVDPVRRLLGACGTSGGWWPTTRRR